MPREKEKAIYKPYSELSDYEKLRAWAYGLGESYRETKRSLVFGGHRYVFNEAGEVIKVQAVMWKSNGNHYYETLAEDGE